MDLDAEFLCTWKISNIALCPQKKNRNITSPIFLMKNAANSKLWFWFHPRKDVSVKLWVENGDSNSFLASGKLEILKKQTLILASKTFENINISNRPTEICTLSMENEDILDYFKTSVEESLFIKCRIKHDAMERNIVECITHSKVNFNHFPFKCVAYYNYSANWLMNEKVFFNSLEYEFEITVTAFDDEDYYDINIRRIEEREDTNVLFCKLALLDISEVEVISMSDIHWYDHYDTNWTFPSFIKKCLLKQNESKYIKNDTFKLLCDFYFPQGKITSEIKYFHNSSINCDSLSGVDVICELQQDLFCMLVDALQSDVKLKVENKIFQAHKCLLSARSPVFKVMFQQNMLENNTDFVDVPDFDAKIFKAFLCFLYSGIMEELDTSDVTKLILVANKYQVTSLIEKCSSLLMTALTGENLCIILALADKISHENLKKTAINYIWNNPSEVLSSRVWNQFVRSNVLLASEVICKLSKIQKNSE